MLMRPNTDTSHIYTVDSVAHENEKEKVKKGIKFHGCAWFNRKQYTANEKQKRPNTKR